MTHGHGAAAERAGARYKRRLLVAFVLAALFVVVEIVAGVLTGSLALLSDAGHTATDVTGVGMALAAIHLADRGSVRAGRTFGLYRLEILAALANAGLLLGVAVYVLVEAARRLGDAPEVLAVPMLAVATVGLGFNVVAFLLLRSGAADSLNVRGAYLEVLADMLGSVGVIVAAVVLALTGWQWVDPLMAVAIGVFILPRAFRLGGQALRVLVQAAPPHTDLQQLHGALTGLDDVVDVHDLHVWTLTSGMEVATAHLMVGAGADTHGVLDKARVVLRDDYGIDHATLQIEPDTHEGCDELSW